MGMSTVSVITTVIVLHLHHQGSTTPVPRWIRKIAFRWVSRLVCLGLHESSVDRMAADASGKDKADEVSLRLLGEHDKYVGKDANNGNVTSNQVNKLPDHELERARDLFIIINIDSKLDYYNSAYGFINDLASI
jgi:hypothetical protein